MSAIDQGLSITPAAIAEPWRMSQKGAKSEDREVSTNDRSQLANRSFEARSVDGCTAPKADLADSRILKDRRINV
jgi:hypothetical protein